MKTKLLFTFIFILSIFLSSCDDDSKLITTSNEANFTLTNLTTSEVVTNESNFLLEDAPILYVSNGDELEFSYTPILGYDVYTFMITFEIGNVISRTTTSSPYEVNYVVDNIPVGDYTVTCTAYHNDDNVTINDYGYVKIRVTQ